MHANGYRVTDIARELGVTWKVASNLVKRPMPNQLAS
jgi:Mn-dependent DtxR family transcriptional regulator